MKPSLRGLVAIFAVATTILTLGCKDPDTEHSEQLGQAMANQGAAMKSMGPARPGQAPAQSPGGPATQ